MYVTVKYLETLLYDYNSNEDVHDQLPIFPPIYVHSNSSVIRSIRSQVSRNLTLPSNQIGSIPSHIRNQVSENFEVL
jgi:hypothetical protein